MQAQQQPHAELDAASADLRVATEASVLLGGRLDRQAKRRTAATVKLLRAVLDMPTVTDADASSIAAIIRDGADHLRAECERLERKS